MPEILVKCYEESCNRESNTSTPTGVKSDLSAVSPSSVGFGERLVAVLALRGKSAHRASGVDSVWKGQILERFNLVCMCVDWRFA